MEVISPLIHQFLRILLRLSDSFLQFAGIHVAGSMPLWAMTWSHLLSRLEKLKAVAFWSILGLRLDKAKDLSRGG
jgi:hypothetical protein